MIWNIEKHKYFDFEAIVRKLVNKKIVEKRPSPMGLEPTTPGLEVRCASHCATMTEVKSLSLN
jgi:hypothetical protein